MCSFGSIVDSRLAAETRRAHAMMDSSEDVLSAARVLESEMVSGSDVLKYAVRLARKVWVFAVCRFWLKRPKCCQPSTKCLLLNRDSAVVEKLGRGIS